NTEAPSHLLIVQKNSSKKELSGDEELLISTISQENEFGSYHINQYIHQHPEIITGDEIKAGKNQYGNAHQVVWQHGNIAAVSEKLKDNLSESISNRFNKKAFQQLSFGAKESVAEGKKLTFLPMPESKGINTSVQLGLFDIAPADNINRAMAYLDEKDGAVVQKQSARILNIVKAKDQSRHEAIVLVAARALHNKQYVYKLYSNVAEIQPDIHWKNADALSSEINNISAALKQYDHKFYNEGEAAHHIEFAEKEDPLDELININPLLKEGALIIYDERIGFVSYATAKGEHPVFKPDLHDKKDLEFYKEYVAIRDAYLSLGNDEVTRDKLNTSYESLVGTYGILNSSANRHRILKDEAFGSIILASLERREGEQYVKADILTQPILSKQELFRTDNALEALAHCLNDQGKTDIDFIAAATGQSQAETIQALGTHIYLNPANIEWETADQFLSGNVVAKLNVAKQKVNEQSDDFQFKRSLDALTKVQPEKVPFELLDFNLGERWIPTEYFRRFASELFEVNTTIRYFPSLDTFKVNANGSNAKITQEYAVTPKNGRTTYGSTLLEHALENTSPFYTYEVEAGDKTIRVPDNEAIQLAHQKIESIRTHFGTWLQELPVGDKRDLEELYNNTFNCYVLREYNGSHLTFPGLNKDGLGIEDLYTSQKNAAWRIIQNRGALIDHEVGLGKTLTMIVAAHEMKRLGIIHKPVILALKANVNQITDTYRKAYPQARILAPGENDFTPAKRQRLSHEIKNNNWDCVILTHDQFSKIPQSPEIQREIFQTELDNVER
ncbi:MAG: DNA methylase, partial [Segetibacter sp.]|nr:DNA methylase [Segetibacter sp.]